MIFKFFLNIEIIKAQLIAKSKRNLNYESNLKRIMNNLKKQPTTEESLEMDSSPDYFNLNLSK